MSWEIHNLESYIKQGKSPIEHYKLNQVLQNNYWIFNLRWQLQIKEISK